MIKQIIGILAVAVILVSSCACAAQRPDASVEELLNLGEQYLLELDYEQALAQFLKVIELEPMNPRGYTGAAEAYLGLGDVDSAVSVLERGYSQTGDGQLQEELESLNWDGHALLAEIYNLFEGRSQEEALEALSELRGEFRRFDQNTPTLYLTPEGRGVGIYYTEGTNMDAYFLYYGEYNGEQRSGEGFWCSVSTSEAPLHEDYEIYEYFSNRFHGRWENDLPNGTGEMFHYGFSIDPGDRSPLVTIRCVGELSNGLWKGEVWEYNMSDSSIQGTISFFEDGYMTVLEREIQNGEERVRTGEFFEQDSEGNVKRSIGGWSSADYVLASYGIPGIAGDKIL